MRDLLFKRFIRYSYFLSHLTISLHIYQMIFQLSTDQSSLPGLLTYQSSCTHWSVFSRWNWPRIVVDQNIIKTLSSETLAWICLCRALWMIASTKDETASAERADIGLRESNDSDDRRKSNKHFFWRPLLIILFIRNSSKFHLFFYKFLQSMELAAFCI